MIILPRKIQKVFRPYIDSGQLWLVGSQALKWAGLLPESFIPNDWDLFVDVGDSLRSKSGMILEVQYLTQPYLREEDGLTYLGGYACRFREDDAHIWIDSPHSYVHQASAYPWRIAVNIKLEESLVGPGFWQAIRLRHCEIDKGAGNYINCPDDAIARQLRKFLSRSGYTPGPIATEIMEKYPKDENLPD
jgi:hypothetical protein